MAEKGAGMDWDAHFTWLQTQPKPATNPVDDLHAEERLRVFPSLLPAEKAKVVL